MTAPLKVISWNLWHRGGAVVGDLADLVEAERPDLLLMQEAKQPLESLVHFVGGTLHWQPMQRRVYGLAAWSPHDVESPYSVPLPVSPFPLRVPPRLAQLLFLDGIAFANVHLSHGQILNRRQLLAVAHATEGPTVIIGDCNAIGAIRIPDFVEVGPRSATHRLQTRLDRCLVRFLSCSGSRVLARGPSDHHPIEVLIEPKPRTTDRAAGAAPRHRATGSKVSVD
ncbi:endonuclease/exonuclease/phosphatase family metal-dependent hydrolase [Dongia mobilis]|uniref:Endonuclease/exonuclease/phosphatase family metal-dependent hydrolase n=1 Tax=Dongia mobilis TaxID=578943 RepID=A0A4R6WP03_9PROT|nr:endonuclease/exonuclease/phosphatase family protein [Dongia mobilis]TDQ80644.1 endonuclease/exonuclease/phosphatase family metal-dependent hydrolase [Dongia mobilis]